MCVCLHACSSVSRVYVQVCVCLLECACVCACVCVQAAVCVCVCVCVCVYDGACVCMSWESPAPCPASLLIDSRQCDPVQRAGPGVQLLIYHGAHLAASSLRQLQQQQPMVGPAPGANTLSDSSINTGGVSPPQDHTGAKHQHHHHHQNHHRPTTILLHTDSLF